MTNSYDSNCDFNEIKYILIKIKKKANNYMNLGC
jgi:hypothetical protein